MRIKLQAPAGEYLLKSIKHNAVYKTIISAVIGGIAAYMSRRLTQGKKIKGIAKACNTFFIIIFQLYRQDF